jgi:hypothetical protein
MAETTLSKTMAGLLGHLGVTGETNEDLIAECLNSYRQERGYPDVVVRGPTHNVLTLTTDPVTARRLRMDSSRIVSLLSQACPDVHVAAVQVRTR